MTEICLDWCFDAMAINQSPFPESAIQIRRNRNDGCWLVTNSISNSNFTNMSKLIQIIVCLHVGIGIACLFDGLSLEFARIESQKEIYYVQKIYETIFRKFSKIRTEFRMFPFRNLVRTYSQRGLYISDPYRYTSDCVIVSSNGFPPVS